MVRTSVAAIVKKVRAIAVTPGSDSEVRYGPVRVVGSTFNVGAGVLGGEGGLGLIVNRAVHSFEKIVHAV